MFFIMWMWIRHRFYNQTVYMLLWSLCVLASSGLKAQGSYSALDIPYHVRSLSMSSAGIADTRGMDITGSNPSLLQSVERGLLISLIRYPAEIQTEIVEWRILMGNRMSAISVRHLGYGIFEKRNQEGEKTGQFSAGETWASLSLAHSLFPSLDIGMTGGLLLSRIDNVSASLAIFTLGGVFTISRFDLRIGFSLRNLGNTIDSYTDHNEPIPTSVNLGITKNLAHLPLDLSIDGTWWSREERGLFRVGGEFSLPYSLKLRLGTSSHRFDLKTNQLWNSVLSETGIGLGYQTRHLSMDMGIHYRGIAGTAIGIGFSTVL